MGKWISFSWIRVAADPGARRPDSRAPMLIGARTRVNAPRLTGRLSRGLTTQDSRYFVTEHTLQGSAAPATAMSNHRLLASVAAWGEDVELAAAWVST